MPESDCGLCDLLIKCGGTVTTDVQFQTLVGKLSCELVTLIQAAVAALEAGPPAPECPAATMSIDGGEFVTIDGEECFTIIV